MTRRSTATLRSLFGSFMAGLAFLAPVLLTLIVLSWFFGHVVAFVGPRSLFGRSLTLAGHFLSGWTSDPLLAFWVGVLLMLGMVAFVGFLIRTRARSFMEDAVDGLIGRIPLLGPVYRPVAQLVRGMGRERSDEMANMQACRITFGGGVETIAFLASNSVFDIGGGPARLVLIPTAPIPVGGAMLLVAEEKVHPIPSMKFDDVAKLYLTMGVSAPPQLLQVVRAGEGGPENGPDDDVKEQAGKE